MKGTLKIIFTFTVFGTVFCNKAISKRCEVSLYIIVMERNLFVLIDSLIYAVYAIYNRVVVAFDSLINKNVVVFEVNGIVVEKLLNL